MNRYILIGTVISGLILSFLTFYIWKMSRQKDIVMIIDRNDRWRQYRCDLTGKGFVRIAGSDYALVENAGMISQKGKTMYIFSEKKPQPLHLSYNENKWLDSDSLSAIINNKLVQQIVKPTDKFMDILIMLGAIGGIISAIAATVVLLVVTGVIKK